MCSVGKTATGTQIGSWYKSVALLGSCHNVHYEEFMHVGRGRVSSTATVLSQPVRRGLQQTHGK